MKEGKVKSFLKQFMDWAQGKPDILAVALVGSYARGEARTDSDLDLVIISSCAEQYTADLSWTATFGEVNHQELEDYTRLTSARVWYADGLEVEYDITDEGWADLPLDEGTRQVISDGMVVLFEQGDLLSRHLGNVGQGKTVKPLA